MRKDETKLVVVQNDIAHALGDQTTIGHDREPNVGIDLPECIHKEADGWPVQQWFTTPELDNLQLGKISRFEQVHHELANLFGRGQVKR
jgi:hypothetical protein